MKTNFKRFLAVLMSFLILLPSLPRAGASFEAPVSVFKIGLYQDTGDGTVRNFVSANLENYAGSGYGYDIGYFNEDREFISVGASILDTNKVTAVIDKNVKWDPSTRSYVEGTDGAVQVGAFHIRLSAPFGVRYHLPPRYR